MSVSASSLAEYNFNAVDSIKSFLVRCNTDITVTKYVKLGVKNKN